MAGTKNNSGRPRKPTALKVIAGTQNVSRVNHAEPDLEISLPAPPTWLKKSARAHYTRIGKLVVQMRVMTDADGEALALLADCYADYLDLSKQVEEDGFTYEVFDKEGNRLIKSNPAAVKKAAAWTQLKNMLVNFGLTPASRAAVNALPQHGNPSSNKKKWR